MRPVLVVDDDHAVLEVIRDMLADLGCEALPARSGAEALQVLERNSHIELLITDINMPGMSGYELAERARRVRQGIRVLLLSARENEGHGFPVLRKPFASAELKDAMSRTVGLC
jgi:two-component system cell cycle response regulator CpdR